MEKTFIKNITNGKLYVIELDLTDSNNETGIVLEKVVSGVKLNDAIVSKYIDNKFEQYDESINLFKSCSRLFKQRVTGYGFISFEPQPPFGSKHIINNEANKCITVVQDLELKWMFDSTDINLGDNISIVFEYSNNGVVYTLLYMITRGQIVSLILGSSSFNGNILLSNSTTNINNNYILNGNDLGNIININYLSLLTDNNINSNGIFVSPKDGVYSITSVINYKFVEITENKIDEESQAPFYSINLITGSGAYTLSDLIAKGNLQLMNYNTVNNHNFSPITSGSTTINAIINLEKNDMIGLVYNNLNNGSGPSIQDDVININGYFNVIMLT